MNLIIAETIFYSLFSNDEVVVEKIGNPHLWCPRQMGDLLMHSLKNRQPWIICPLPFVEDFISNITIEQRSLAASIG